ncbi:MAG: DUF5682 family protein [Armatimonadota bacterium]
MAALDIQILGIRHHGPGSARSVKAALEALLPEAILVEGPPDAAEVLPLLLHAEMRPPVALLIYQPEEPNNAALYPFAVFSPEWQALSFGLQHHIPVRFMDLPQAHQLALRKASQSAPDEEPPLPEEQRDPLGCLAVAAGYSDGERWWEHMVEQRRDSADLFAAILEAMSELRQTAALPERPEELMREAYMRRTIRKAQQEGYGRIAVVCGAWHGPALASMPPAGEDDRLLHGLPKIRVQATWVPWTYSRLAAASGYGAGILSPGWYHHLWECARQNLSPTQVAVTWLTQVAQLMRAEELDVSTAHIIETVRLTESLAALRERPLPGLPELMEATLAVCCAGNELPLRIIGEKLIVGERLGEVPAETPAVPLQQDLQREQRRLRFPPDPEQRTVDLDLRNETDLARSHLLHRLRLLEIPWGSTEAVSGKSGTFHELWTVQWQPEFAVSIIEASMWGNTVADAADAAVRHAADTGHDIETLAQLLDKTLLANLPDAAAHVMSRVENQAAVASDIPSLMGALPPLVRIMRYSNVRQTDAGMVRHVVDGLLARICIGLPGACAALNDEATAEMYERLLAVHGAVIMTHEDDYLTPWQDTLHKLLDQQGLHGLLAGRCCRLLHDAGQLPAEEVARRLSLALSRATVPAEAGAWIDGLLRDSGLILLHDDELWQVLDDWLGSLGDDLFINELPLLRRTFATFTDPERRQLGERAKRKASPPVEQPAVQQGFDATSADEALSSIADLFGLGDDT